MGNTFSIGHGITHATTVNGDRELCFFSCAAYVGDSSGWDSSILQLISVN